MCCDGFICVEYVTHMDIFAEIMGIDNSSMGLFYALDSSQTHLVTDTTHYFFFESSNST